MAKWPCAGAQKLEHRNKEGRLQNFVHMMSPGSKLAPRGAQKLEHRNKEGKLQNFSSLKLEGVEI